MWKTPAQNISREQIDSQIDALNRDYRMRNPDVGSVPAVFQPLVADARLEFELASVDPDGNPTDGITRTQTNVDSFSTDDSVKPSASGGADAWPRDNYLNLWVCQLGGGLLGYAQFPGGPAATDGVVILHSAFGTTGTAAAPFDRGPTATHEIGHLFNLRHIWGDDGDGCGGSDFVPDTPNQAGPNYGTPTFPSVSCGNDPNGDLFMNYMDYVDEAAMMMFTQGQVVRMQATLDSTRSMLGTTIPCGKALPKDLPKEAPKDLPKELPKDLPKDPPKDIPKDVPKEWPKDLPKDLPKDPPKDWPKESPFDPGPKAFDPGPKAFDPGPFGPWGPGGGTPFVLATPARVGPCPCQGQWSAWGGDPSAAYRQILEQYAWLHAQGRLDAAGMAAWQSAAEAYRQLFGGGGPYR